MTGNLKKKIGETCSICLFVYLSRKNNLKLCTEDIWKCLSDLKILKAKEKCQKTLIIYIVLLSSLDKNSIRHSQAMRNFY